MDPKDKPTNVPTDVTQDQSINESSETTAAPDEITVTLDQDSKPKTADQPSPVSTGDGSFDSDMPSLASEEVADQQPAESSEVFSPEGAAVSAAPAEGQAVQNTEQQPVMPVAPAPTIDPATGMPMQNATQQDASQLFSADPSAPISPDNVIVPPVAPAHAADKKTMIILAAVAIVLIGAIAVIFFM